VNSLYIRLDGDQGELIKQLMLDRDCSAQKVGAHILRTFFTIGKPSKEVALVLPKKAPAKRFTKPTLFDVATEFELKGSRTCQDDADTFFNHYESNGWKVGKNGMKNWKATVAQWHKRNKEGNTHGKNQPAKVSDLDLDGIDY